MGLLFTKEDAVGITTLLLKLPKLKEIKLFRLRNEDEDAIQIISAGLCEYLKKFHATLGLKVKNVGKGTWIPIVAVQFFQAGLIRSRA